MLEKARERIEKLFEGLNQICDGLAIGIDGEEGGEDADPEEAPMER